MNQSHLRHSRVRVIPTPAGWTSSRCRQELSRRPKSLRGGSGQLAGWWCITTTCRSGCGTMTFWWKGTGRRWIPTGNASSRCSVFTPRPATSGLICSVRNACTRATWLLRQIVVSAEEVLPCFCVCVTDNEGVTMATGWCTSLSSKWRAENLQQLR